MHSPARRCLVHIGPAKTGTSYLQSVLWASRDALAAQGLVLPLAQRDHFHFALALRGLLTQERFPPEAFTALDRMSTAAASVPPGSNALISQERLAAATAEEVHRLVGLLPGWDVHIVITARDLARQIPSVWQQTIKSRHPLDYAEFLRAVVDRSPLAEDFWLRQDFAALSARWSSVVPRERIHFVTIPPAGSPPGLLLERFCSVLGVDPTQLNIAAAVSNPSLGHAQAEVLRRANIGLVEASGDPVAPAARWGAAYLAKEVLASQEGRPPEFPRELQDWCRQTAAETIAHLESRGYDVAGDLVDLIPNFSAGSGAVAVITDAEVAAAAAEALATVVAQRYDDVEQRRRLRGRLRKQAKRLAKLDDRRSSPRQEQ